MPRCAPSARSSPWTARPFAYAHIPTSTGTGTGTGGGYRQPHLVSVLDQASGVVLGQVEVEAKSNEIGAFTIVLDDLDL